jgi:hypothetical protein
MIFPEMNSPRPHCLRSATTLPGASTSSGGPLAAPLQRPAR